MRGAPRRGARPVALVAWAVAVAGCHSYRPVTVPAVADEVQLRLTAEGSTALTTMLGPGVRLVEGTVRERRPDGALVLGGTTLVLDEGERRPGPRGTVAIPMAAIAGAERQVLDKGRTRLMAATVVGAFTAVVVSVLRGTRFRGQGQTGQGPGVPE